MFRRCFCCFWISSFCWGSMLGSNMTTEKTRMNWCECIEFVYWFCMRDCRIRFLWSQRSRSNWLVTSWGVPPRLRKHCMKGVIHDKGRTPPWVRATQQCWTEPQRFPQHFICLEIYSQSLLGRTADSLSLELACWCGIAVRVCRIFWENLQIWRIRTSFSSRNGNSVEDNPQLFTDPSLVHS